MSEKYNYQYQPVSVNADHPESGPFLPHAHERRPRRSGRGLRNCGWLVALVLTGMLFYPMLLRCVTECWQKYWNPVSSDPSVQPWINTEFEPSDASWFACDPSIEVGEPSMVVMDPEKTSRLHMMVRGINTVTDLKFHRVDLDDNKIHIKTKLFVSDNNLKDDVSVECDDSSKGLLRYTVKTPRLSMPTSCVRAEIHVMVPEKLEHLEEIYAGFMRGSLMVHKNMKELVVHRFKMNGGMVDMDMDGLRADSVVLENARGNITGHVCMKKMFKARTYSGNMNLCVQAPHEGKPHISASNVNGDIHLRMSDKFNCEFDASTYMGEAEVKGSHLKLEVDEKVHKKGCHATGSKEKGKVEMATVKGNVCLLFE